MAKRVENVHNNVVWTESPDRLPRYVFARAKRVEFMSCPLA
jgi:hypothetical protein